MRIAHFSDLHLLSYEGVRKRRFLNKRLTGWANLRFKRHAIHHAAYVRAIARDIAAAPYDHVIVTGDLTNLALESEYELARDVLANDLGLDPSRVSIVPGNHDLYTRGSLTSRRFETFFGPWLTSALPELSADASGARFPFVKLLDGVAVIGLSSAVPRLPFVAAGALGTAQIRALARILEHPEVSRRTVVVALHHPPLQTLSRAKHHLEGLRDSAALLSVLRSLPRGLVVHGHLHRRTQRMIITAGGRLEQVGATSASLQHTAPERMAGYNVYELDARGIKHIDARVFDPRTSAFHVTDVPRQDTPRSA